MADDTRRAVFERVVQGPASVSQPAEGLPVSRPAVSQHLAVLRSAGLVETKKVGTRSIHAARREGIEPLRRYLDSMWDDALAAFAEQARKEAKQLKRAGKTATSRRKKNV